MYAFRNLVFEGGGIKGIAYLGAMDVLEKKGILKDIVRVAGTSAGAINALLLGLGYTTREIRNIMWELDFKKFQDNKWSIFSNSYNFFTKYGWYKGKFFMNWVEGLIEGKTGHKGCTFRELNEMNYGQFREIFFIGTNISTGFAEVFSYIHTPDMKIADAVRISMSIPFFFTACKGREGDIFVDGGVMENYPIKLFDREKYILNGDIRIEREYYEEYNKKLAKSKSPYVYNHQTLGFRLDSGREISLLRDRQKPKGKKIRTIFGYTRRLINTMMEIQNNYHIHSDDWQRTVYINTLGVKTTDFDISANKKKDLLKSGTTHSENYFKWFDDKKSTPINRV